MPLLKNRLRKRELRPRVVQALHRELENTERPLDEREAIAKALDDPKLTEKVNGFTFNLIKKDGKLEPPPEVVAAMAASPGIVAGPFLDWVMQMLKDYLPQIIAYLVKLFL